MFPETLKQLEIDLQHEGSDLAGVNAEFTFTELPVTKIKVEMNSEVLNQKCLFEENNKNNFLNESEIKKENDLNQMFPCSANNSVNMSCPIDFQPIPSRVIPLDGLELVFRAPSAAKFLILAIKDRIRHGRHFTFKGQKFAVTFVAESVTGSIVSKQNPFGIIGYWMQVIFFLNYKFCS